MNMERRTGFHRGLASAIVACLGVAGPASAAVYTRYAAEIPNVSDWNNESYALGDPSDCDQTGCCATNSVRTSAVWLAAHDVDPFTIPSHERVVGVAVGAYTRYDRNTVHCNVRLRVYSGIDIVPDTMSDFYVWDQGNSGECRWVDWTITHLRTNWTEYDVNHFRVALRRFQTDTPSTTCRVNGFRIVVTTEALGACCREDGSCLVTAENPCTLQGGDWYPREVCSPCPCDPVCSLIPETLDFGEVQVAHSLDRSFVIHNPGCATLSGFVGEPCANFAITSGGGAFSLPPAGTRTVVIQYAPQAVGDHECSISLGTDCGELSCSGSGYLYGACCGPDGSCLMTEPDDCNGFWQGNDTLCAPDLCPRCRVDPEFLSFGDVPAGGHRDLDFTIRNAGGGSLAGSVVLACPSYSILAGGGGFALPAGAARTVTVRFAPVDVGDFDCEVDLGTPLCENVFLDGSGVSYGACCDEGGTCAVTQEGDCWWQWLGQGTSCEPSPCSVCLVWPKDIDFGEVLVGTSRDTTFVIRNTGGGTLSGNVTESCAGFSVLIGGGPFALGPQDERIVTLRFAPPDTALYFCPIDLGTELCPEVTGWGSGERAGACCLGSGACVISSELDCLLQDGLWLLSPCDPNPCGPGSIVLPEIARSGIALRIPNPYLPGAPIVIGSIDPGEGAVEVFDASGRVVRSLLAGPIRSGVSLLSWDGRAASGQIVGSGTYFLRGRVGGRSSHRSFVLVR